MKTTSATEEFGPARAVADGPAERVCLRCRTRFLSEGFGERICGRCKGTVAWRSAVSVTAGQGGRRRSGGSAA